MPSIEIPTLSTPTTSLVWMELPKSLEADLVQKSSFEIQSSSESEDQLELETQSNIESESHLESDMHKHPNEKG